MCAWLQSTSMATRKIRNWWWVDFRYEFTRYRKKSPVNTKGGAQAYEAQLRERLARGESLDWHRSQAKETTFEAFAWEWFETYVKANNKPSEQRSKEHILRVQLVPWFGKKPLPAVDSQAVEAYKRSALASGTHPKTLNNQLAVLSRLLTCAQEWSFIAARPTVRLVRYQRPRFDFLSESELEQLLAVGADTRWYAMVALAATGGLRVGELLALRWSRVDLARGLVTVDSSISDGFLTTTKSDRTRHVPLSARAHAALTALPRRSEYVFPDADGDHLNYRKARHALDKLVRAAGLRRIGWHVLRHTCASHLVMRGAHLAAIRDVLGHAHVTMTERYAHLSASATVAAVRLLDLPMATTNCGHPVGTAMQEHARPLNLPTENCAQITQEAAVNGLSSWSG